MVLLTPIHFYLQRKKVRDFPEQKVMTFAQMSNEPYSTNKMKMNKCTVS